MSGDHKTNSAQRHTRYSPFALLEHVFNGLCDPWVSVADLLDLKK